MGNFLPRQTITAPIGLVTQPNQYNQYPSGAGRIVRNLVMRNPGELVQAPDVQSVQSVGAANNIIHKLAPLDDGHVYSFHENSGTWSVRENNNSVTWIANNAAVSSESNAFPANGKVSWARVAERMLVNASAGFLVCDYMAPNSVGERGLRHAGLCQPILQYSGDPFVDDGAGWLADNQMVGYTCCFVREFADGYKLRSVRSPPIKIRPISGTGPYNIQLIANWSDNALVVGDQVELYRTDTLNTDSDLADPGDVFKLILTITLTSSNISNAFVTVKDVQPNVAGTLEAAGDELYSNPGQEGSTYENRRPPMAACVASFKGFAFYGNTTERAKFTFSVPGGWGSQAYAVDAGLAVATFKKYGIGTRTGSGTITNGSPTVTSVSTADMVGVVVGQNWGGGAQFAGTATVVSVGATSFTMSANASSGGSGWVLYDVMEINGTKYPWIDALFVSGLLDGLYEMTLDQTIALLSNDFLSAFEMSLERNYPPFNTNITVRATNGANYSPVLPEIGATVKTIAPLVRKNRIQWSKEQQPEHCPSASEDFVGFGEIYSMRATRDAIWIACSDGLFRLSGHAGAFGHGSWQVDYANSSLLLAAPQASTTMNEFWYGYTNIGFVEVDSAGNWLNLSDKFIGDLLPGQKYSATRSIVVECNEKDQEILVQLGDNGAGSSNTVYVFNTKQRGWTTLGGNGANLSNITALAMQRSPSSGEPRVLFGVSPLAGGTPSYSGWNNPTSFLAHELRLQPIYGDEPLELKRWLWADYLFDMGSNGKQITPQWNGITFGGNVTIEAFDQGAYARAGCPREVARSHSISPGFLGASGSTQSRFQGFSIPLKQSTNQSKKR